MRTPALIAVVATLHIVAVGAFFFIQGCGTQSPSVEPPPAPIMPPAERPVSRTLSSSVPPPVFQPPVPVEQALPVAELGDGATYVIQKGDSLSKIAARFGVKSRELAELNGISNPNKIRIGQKLLLPAYAQSVPGATVGTVSQPTSRRVMDSGSTYVIQRGDNLTKIAKLHGVSLKELRAVNNLKSDKILVGQKLTIPGAVPVEEAAPVMKPVPISIVKPKPVVVERVVAPVPEPVAISAPVAATDNDFKYTVSEGDTLESIARDFVVLKEDLMRANRITSGGSVRTGQTLVIPIGSPAEY